MPWNPVERSGGASTSRTTSEWLVRVSGGPALEAQPRRGLRAVPVVIAAAFPETAGHTLEEIAPERPHRVPRPEKEPA